MPQQPFLVGLIGAGVGPSLTPALHMREAAAHGLDYVYRTIDIAALGTRADRDRPDPDPRGALLGFDALNVTHPCKQLVIEHLDAPRRDGRPGSAPSTPSIFGERRRGRPQHRHHRLRHRGPHRAAGRAGHARWSSSGPGAPASRSRTPCSPLGTDHLVVVDVDEDRSDRAGPRPGRPLPRRPGSRAPTPTSSPCCCRTPTGWCTARPTGMADHPGLPARPGPAARRAVGRRHRLPAARHGAAAGGPRAPAARTLDGGHMAVHQAVDAFRLITGIDPDPDRMLAHLRELAARRG